MEVGARTLIAAMKISADGKMEGSEDTAACAFAEACTTATRAPFCLTPLVSSRVENFDDSRTASPAIDVTMSARAVCHMGHDYAAWLYRR
jgi:hypothetical protein